ncbi:hypothetical protein SUGI_1093850 [Cryptomeria japonica]|nr:hypothetical protein SUGI_1093850 [Cryptomeria japonica]
MFAAFMKLSIPTVAAICGHAEAIAFTLALAHDYRFMSTQGSSHLYMCELDHGFNIPKSMLALIRSKLHPAALRDVVLGGTKLNAQMAFQKGIVDAAFDDSVGTLQAAVKEAEKLAVRGWNREIYRSFMFPIACSLPITSDAHLQSCPDFYKRTISIWIINIV